jgi:hypothetical protein
MLARVRQGSSQDVALTTVSTEYGAQEGWLALRGDQAPLSWELGWPASRDGDRWTVALSEVQVEFDYKWLRDDTDWQQGDNQGGQPGQANEGTVVF